MRLAADFAGPVSINPPAPSFSFGGFGFSSSHPMATRNTPGNSHGLSFHAAGVDVTLPAITATVLLRVVCGADEVRVRGFDANNHAVATLAVPADGQIHDVQLAGESIVRVTLDHGGNEGFLIVIAQDVELA